jgi:hypothetical protein
LPGCRWSHTTSARRLRSTRPRPEHGSLYGPYKG